MAYIYKIRNQINGKVYIGKTLENIEERWKQHIKNAAKIENQHRPLYRAINKYGIENFTIEQVEECDYTIVNEREQYWINFYQSYIGFKPSFGYNATLGGDGCQYIDYSTVINIYIQNHNMTQTGKLLGIRRDTVSKILKDSSIKIISPTASKKVLQYDLEGNLIQEYSSLSLAAKSINKFSSGAISHISDVCKGKRKTAYGYIWKYVEQ